MMFDFKFLKRKKKELTLEEIQKTLGNELSFSASEAYKLLRANLAFSFPDEKGCKIIGITSATNGEGKSTTSINLAYAIAQAGERVLLLDGDMRLPTIAKKLSMNSTPGLSNVLAGQSDVNKAIKPSKLHELMKIMPAGDTPPNPSELINSAKMESVLKELSEDFDYIIIDLPPINVVVDAAVIAKKINGVIIAVRRNYCGKSEVDAAVKQLEFANARLLGFVFTGAQGEGRGYRRYGKYKYYSYGGKSSKEKK